jgi:hypothetical protein
MLRDMMGQRVLARIPDLAQSQSIAPTVAVAPKLIDAPGASPPTATRKPAASIMRNKPAWDPSQLRIPRISPRAKLILGACLVVVVIWFVRGRFGGETATHDNAMPIDLPTRLTVVPLDEPPMTAPLAAAQQSPAVAAPPNLSPASTPIRQAEVPRYDDHPPVLPAPPSGAAASQRQAVAPPSTQPIPAWQEPASPAARHDFSPPGNSTGVTDRPNVTPPTLSPLWPQDARRPQPPSGPRIQHNQFAEPQPAAASPVETMESQIEWAAPFAPSRGAAGRADARTSDRRGEPARAPLDGTNQLSPQPRNYDGRTGSFVH